MNFDCRDRWITDNYEKYTSIVDVRGDYPVVTAIITDVYSVVCHFKHCFDKSRLGVGVAVAIILVYGQ